VKAKWIPTLAVLAASAHAPSGLAAEFDLTSLEPITVIATGLSNMTAVSAGDISQEQMQSLPLLRPAAVLENVPGLIVTQHSGEGKANQYFLRAFNLDHGTDLALDVDDMPVNMPTHAHGQGYSDLNFLIPELAGDLHYKKGPYYADEGDFATAGTTRISLVSDMPSSATLGFGEDGYRRALLMGSTLWAGGTLLGAGEVYHNDGPFEVPDDYNRLNGVLRYHHGDEKDFYTLTAMAYSGRWNSTDQVPLRAISDGVIDRFGSLNPTDGGISSRESFSFSRVKRTDADQVQFSAYVIRYKLDLWSTFTYYLRDPVNGDQMLQHDDRVVYGFKGSKTWYTELLGMPVSNVIGVQARIDDIRDVGIFSTYQRQTIGTTQNAGVTESNGAVYAESSIQWAPKLRTVAGVREDQFNFDVKDKMLNADGSCNIHSDPEGCVTGNRRASIFSPKLGIIFGPWAETTFFINAGDGEWGRRMDDDLCDAVAWAVAEGHADPARIAAAAKFDGIYIIRTNAQISPLVVALRYRERWIVEDIFRTAKSIINTRPIFHQRDDTIRGHVFCSFLALLLRKELIDRLAAAGRRYEWTDIISDLDQLAQTDIDQAGRRLRLRAAAPGCAGAVFQAVGVALPPTIQLAAQPPPDPLPGENRIAAHL